MKINEESLLSLHFQAFYQMVYLTTMIANVSTPEYDEDARKFIALVGNAYGLKEEEIAFFSDLIVDELSALPTYRSARAFTENLPQNFPHKDAYGIKADVIYALHSLAHKTDHFPVPTRFDCAIYMPYFPSLRRGELLEAAFTGNLPANRALALFEELGIGGPRDHEGAIVRLKQCAYWGDTLSFRLLAYLGEGRTREIFAAMVENIPSLDRGELSLDPSVDEDIAETYEIIAHTRQSVVLSLHRPLIDYSYVEAIQLPDLPLSRKLLFAKFYGARGWKSVTNPSENPTKRFGFSH